MTPDLQHFLMLAKDSATLGEADSIENFAANQLAEVVLDTVGFLDESALRGLCEFIGRAKYAPHATRELLES